MDRYRTIPGPYGTYGIWDDDRKCWHMEGQAITWEWRTAKPLCDKLNGTGKARQGSAEELMPASRSRHSPPKPPDTPAQPSADAIYEGIKHGDELHRKWLRDAIDNLFAGKPVPPPYPPAQATPALPSVAAALADVHTLVVRHGLCGRIWCDRCQDWDHECGCEPGVAEQAMADLEAAISALIAAETELRERRVGMTDATPPSEGKPAEARALAGQIVELVLREVADAYRDARSTNKKYCVGVAEHAITALSAVPRSPAVGADDYAGRWACFECGTVCDSPMTPKGNFACSTCGAYDLMPEAVGIRVSAAYEEERKAKEQAEASLRSTREALQAVIDWYGTPPHEDAPAIAKARAALVASTPRYLCTKCGHSFSGDDSTCPRCTTRP